MSATMVKSPVDTWWDERRYGVELLFHEHFADWTAAAEMFDTTPRTIMRWIESGVNWEQADRIACRLGFHPTQLWADWGSLPEEVFNDPIPPTQERIGGCPGCRACRPRPMERVWPKQQEASNGG